MNMKIEISIEKGEKENDKGEGMGEDMEEHELTPEQIAKMAARLKGRGALSRSERVMLANYLMQEKED